jgi:predicted O-methyltransferase YrrM
MPDAAFPNMIVGATSLSQWPFLRRDIAHNWYVDKRNPTVGFVSRDEAAILYNTARAFEGLPCLEVGCWRGWSTVHLALGSRNLEVIDPVLRDDVFRKDLTETLRRAGVLERVVLHDGFSPEEIEHISVSTGKRWSLSFIDGDHEGDAPRRDAEMLARFAAEDAAILVHDLASPHPAGALEYLHSQGWETWIYQTMQIMGVAVRGATRPIEHIPDPTQSWTLPAHLAHFPVIGERRSARLVRVTGFSEGKVSSAQIPDTAALDDLPEDVATLIDALLSQIAVLGHRVHTNRQDMEAAAAFDALHRKHMDLISKLTDASRERDEIAGERAAFDLLRLKHMDLSERLARLQLERDNLVRGGEQLAAELADMSRERDALSRRLEYSIRRIVELEHQRTLNAELMPIHVSALPTRSAQHVDDLPAEHVDDLPIRQFSSSWMARKRILFGLARRIMAGRKAEVRSLIEQSLRAHGMSGVAMAAVIDWLSAPRVILGLGRRHLFAGIDAVQGLVVFEMQRRIDESGLLRGSNAQLLSAAELKRSLEIEVRRFLDLDQRFRALEAAKLSDEQALLAAQIANAKLLAQATPSATTMTSLAGDGS